MDWRSNMEDQQPALQLYDYQKRWIQDDSRFKIAMFARQCGDLYVDVEVVANLGKLNI